VSERLAAAGAVVVAGCYTEQGRADLQRALPSAVVLPLDVTSQLSVDAFAAETLRRFPAGVYAVVNNASVGTRGPGDIARLLTGGWVVGHTGGSTSAR
jgi:NAD(P)-dependent dehydrogenase (short-subunit alcohol dehydrogenase family)